MSKKQEGYRATRMFQKHFQDKIREKPGLKRGGSPAVAAAL